MLQFRAINTSIAEQICRYRLIFDNINIEATMWLNGGRMEWVTTAGVGSVAKKCVFIRKR